MPVSGTAVAAEQALQVGPVDGFSYLPARLSAQWITGDNL
jgi:hypothetical protein